MDLNGAVVVVTGAARGIGKRVAAAYAAEGAKVAIVDVLAKELDETAAEMKGKGATALAAACDVTDPAQVEAMAARVERELGPVDVLYNNAGTFSVIAPVWEADPERWFLDVRVSLYGTFLCCHAFVGGMVARRRGCVINVTSGGPIFDPHPYCTSYGAAKVGQMRLTEGLAKEVAEYGVKVFAVSPGTVLTEMTKFIMNDAGGKKWRPTFHKAFESGRDVSPDRIAALAVDLARGRADALSGRFINATQDLEETLGRTEEILKENRLTLRMLK